MSEEISSRLWRDENEQYAPRNLYNSRPPSEYHPNLNAPAVQSHDYIPEKDWESHHVPNSNDPRLFPPFPETDPVEPPITYEQSEMISGFFLKEMENEYQLGQDAEAISRVANILSRHTVSDFNDLTEALVQLRKVFPEDHPDIVSLSTAQRIFDHQMHYMANPLLMPELMEPIQDYMLGL